MPTAAEQGGLYIPIAQVMPLHIQRLGETSTMLIRNRAYVDAMSQVFGGRSAKPQGIVAMPAADGETPILVAGLGECEVAEMEDILTEALEKTEAQVKKTGTAIDFESERAARGAPSAETFDQRLREYMQARVDYGKQNIRTALTTPFGQHVREQGGLSRGQSQIALPTHYKES